MFDNVELGDMDSSKNNYVWVVEKKVGNLWYPVLNYVVGMKREHAVKRTRAGARYVAKTLRHMGAEVRVVAYKACLDSVNRHNRQIESERLDYPHGGRQNVLDNFQETS